MNSCVIVLLRVCVCARMSVSSLSVNGKSYISVVHPHITLDLFPLLSPEVGDIYIQNYRLSQRARKAGRWAEKERVVLSDLTCYSGVS